MVRQPRVRHRMGPGPLRMQQIHDTTGGGAMECPSPKLILEEFEMDHNERAIVRPGDPLVDVLVDIADRLDRQCLDLRKAAECGDLCSANYKLGRVDAELTIMADRLRDEAMAIEDAAEVMNG